jgi:hypothetical protein
MSKTKRLLLVSLSYFFITYLFFARHWLFKSPPHYAGMFTDPLLFIWVFKWWLYSIQHHLNPLFCMLARAPVGISLMKITNIPLLGLLALPITYLFGALTSYNFFLSLGPPITAISLFLFLRYLIKNDIAAWFGGYLFGFSSFEITHYFAGHVNWVWLCFLPAIAWLCCAYMRQEIKKSMFVTLTTLMLIAQFLISKELFFTLNIALTLWATLFFLLAWDQRKQTIIVITAFLTALILALLFLSPLIVIYFCKPHSVVIYRASHFAASLTNLVIPTSLTWLGGNALQAISAKFHTMITEQTAYIGLPLLFIALWTFAKNRRNINVTISFYLSLIFTLLALGPELKILGQHMAWMPWAPFYAFHLISKTILARYFLFVFFMLSVLLATWVANKKIHPLWRYGLAILALIFILPNPTPSNLSWSTPMPSPALLNNKTLHQFIPKKSRIFVLQQAKFNTPYNRLSMLWQLQNNAYFTLTSGDTGISGITKMVFGYAPYPRYLLQKKQAFLKLMKETKTDIIMMPQSDYASYRPIIQTLIKRHADVGGVQLVYLTQPKNA